MRASTVKPKSGESPCRRAAKVKREWHEQLQPRADLNDLPIRRLRFQKEVRQALPRETIFMGEGVARSVTICTRSLYIPMVSAWAT